MIIDPKLGKSLSLALGFPSTILVCSWAFMKLAREDIIPIWLAVLLFVLVVGNPLFMMVYFSYKKNDLPLDLEKVGMISSLKLS